MISQITFKKAYNLPNTTQNISTSVQEINGNYIFLGSAYQNTFRVGLLKTNSTGNPILNKYLAGVDEELGVTVFFPISLQSIRKNNSIYFITPTYNVGNSKGRFSLIKINENLDTLFKTKYYISGDTLNYFPVSIISTGPNDLVVLTKVEATTAYIQQLLLIKYDTLGNVKWEKRINNPYSGIYLVPSSISFNTAEKTFYISGFLGSSGAWYNPFKPLVIKTDSIGNVIWKKNVFQSINNRAQQNCGIISTSDNNQVFAGYTVPVGDSVYVGGSYNLWRHKMPPKPSLTKIDNNGNVLWRTTFEDTCYLCQDNYFTSLTETLDNKIVAMGRGQIVTGNATVDSTNVIIAKVDLNGSIIWRKDYVFCSDLVGDNMWVNEIKQTADSGFIITGSSFCKKFIGIKLDKNGCLHLNCSITNNITEFRSESPKVEVFPNPTNGVVNIGCQSLPLNETLTIQITNYLGQNLKTTTIQNNSNLNIENLPKGIYFVRISSNLKIIGSKKIILV